MVLRISTRLGLTAAAAALTLPALAGCGGAPTPAPAPAAAPSASATNPSSAPASTPTPATPSVDETKAVKDATATFIGRVFTLRYSDSAKDYHARVRPLLTEKFYATLTKEVDVDQGLKTGRSRFGADARSRSRVVGQVKVEKLSPDDAATWVKWVTEIQKPKGDGWKTIKESVDETSTISLVKQDGKWLIENVT